MSLFEKECAYCGKMIYQGRTDKIYCSRRCGVNAYKSKKKIIIIKICKGCSIEFKAKSKIQKYCSHDCNSVKICACGCGQEFKININHRYRGNNQSYITGHNSKTEEWRELKRKINTGKTISVETKEKIRETKRRNGTQKHSSETKRKISESNKGKVISQETRDKLKVINSGKKHTEETRKKCKEIAFEKNYGSWMNGKIKSEESKLKQSKALAGKMPKNMQTPGKFQNVQRGYFNIDGDIIFLRSKWEANYARYLSFLKKNKVIIDWKYEEDTFVFHEVEFGKRSYCPDFKVTLAGGKINYHEVKGWMDDGSKTKLRRMKKYYPEIEIILIDEKEYNDLSKKMKGLIPRWNDPIIAPVREEQA